MSLMATARVLALIAVRNVFSHKVTSLIVGSIIMFGTSLVVMGTAFLDSIEASMARSVTSSFAGHIQVHSSEARDPIALFGTGFMAMNDIGELRDFSRVKEVVEAVPNVRAVVPMGQALAQVATENAIDAVLVKLRAAVEARDEERIASLAAQVRVIAADLAREQEQRLELAEKDAEIHAALADLARVQADAFWEELRRDPEPQLLFLDTKLAPLYEEAQLIFLRILGTDLDRFTQLFDRFELARGERVPPHSRGLLLSSYMYERFMKNKVARDLDRLKRERDERGNLIAQDAGLTNIASQLPNQYQRVTFDLDPAEAREVEAALRGLLGRSDGELDALVQELLRVDDANFDARYRFFYDVIAPKIELHAVRVGDTVTLRSFTKTGYLKSVNVVLYGIFEFEGLEGSDLAGSQNLLDMMTFRDLYGTMTPEKQRELAGLRAELGLAEIGRAEAEEELFGGGESIVEERIAEDSRFDELAGADLRAARREAQSAEAQRFTAEEVERGLALSGAVLIDDARELPETVRRIEAAAKEAGLALKAVDWQTAAGIVGQFVVVVRLVLYVAIVIIFLVALVIINNSMVMATMERVAEIGTMRAIGAQRLFVMALFLLETLALGVVTGLVGAGLGVGVIAAAHRTGIPSNSDVLTFLFSGPRLYPDVGPENVLFGVVAVLVVSIASTLYPARIATRIQPVVAMQVKE